MSDYAFNAAARSRLRGAGSFRRLLKQLGPAVKEELAEQLDDAGVELLAAMRADVAVKTGALRAGLVKKLLRASLRVRVGMPTTLRGRANLFYGRIVERGRKSKTVTVRRKRRVSRQTYQVRAGEFRRSGGQYKMRVRAMAPRPFVFKRREALRGAINTRIRTFWDRALADAAQGVSFE